MTRNEVEEFEFFLWECLKEEANIIELRLSKDEMEYLKNKYPGASLREMPTMEFTDNKAWYEVTL